MSAIKFIALYPKKKSKIRESHNTMKLHVTMRISLVIAQLYVKHIDMFKVYLTCLPSLASHYYICEELMYRQKKIYKSNFTGVLPCIWIHNWCRRWWKKKMKRNDVFVITIPRVHIRESPSRIIITIILSFIIFSKCEATKLKLGTYC